VTRELKFHQALLEATEIAMQRDPSVYVMGLGVPDPKGIFGSTLDLHKKFGDARALDMPTSENGMTGVAIGSALAGMRPVLTHQRIDFALLSIEQIVNQAAKWHFMFGGLMKIPLVIRMIVGRGWGQGPQHSQSLQAWFAHVPGLKVVMPATPHDAKGLLIASIEDDNPVIFIEHRWLYGMSGAVPESHYTVPLGKAKVAREGKDLTIVATSYMTLEALRAADRLAEEGVQAEIVDLRSLRPLDETTVMESVRKTGRLIVSDTGWKTMGIGAEILARVAEECHGRLKTPPSRVCLPDSPTPTSPPLADQYYPRALHLWREARRQMGLPAVDGRPFEQPGQPLDVPDPTFTGPF
jgi:pyruvate dehydrogenase E1 component beta subunit